ncbi:MAG: SRPBCC domain-containing protein [Gemmatimonadota bacterium]|nr:SRPBCC domain-containing protein [Gemmatimonadota bacterium]
MEKTEGLDEAVRVDLLIEAKPETIFRIMSSSEGLSNWLNAEASLEPVVGAPLTLRFPSFRTTVAGQVREVVPNRRLSVSWGVSEGPQAEWLPAGSTRVTFELAPEGDGTRVRVTHEALPTEQEAANHRQGWRFHLSRLELLSNRAQLEAVLPAIMDRYYEAWSSDDSEACLGLLEEVCAKDVSFADEYASLEGVDRLALHASNTRKYMPGTRVRRMGGPVVCRGRAIVPWEVIGESEDRRFQGTDYMEIRADGRLTGIVGFWTTHPEL